MGTKLALAVDVMMVQAKRIYIFLRNGKHVLHISIGLYETVIKVLENLKSCGNTCLWLMFPQHFSFSQTSTHVSIKQLDYELEISIA